MNHRIYQVIRNNGAVGMFADFGGRNNFFGRNNQVFAGTSHLKSKSADAVDLAIAINIGTAHMNKNPTSRTKAGNKATLSPVKGALNHFCRWFFQGVGSQHTTGRHKRNAHGRRFKSPGQSRVRPFYYFTNRTVLHPLTKQVWNPVNLKPDVGKIDFPNQIGSQQ